MAPGFMGGEQKHLSGRPRGVRPPGYADVSISSKLNSFLVVPLACLAQKSHLDSVDWRFLPSAGRMDCTTST